MKNNIGIKHIHANVGGFNGQLVFLVDDRLLSVEVGTPNFNDYNAWNIFNFRLSSKKYNPEDNEVELEPYNIDVININSDDLEFLTIASRIHDDGIPDDEWDIFVKKFGNYELPLTGVRYKYDKSLSILFKDGSGLKICDWEKRKEKTSYEKILYPILKAFKSEYLNQTKKS